MSAGVQIRQHGSNIVVICSHVSAGVYIREYGSDMSAGVSSCECERKNLILNMIIYQYTVNPNIRPIRAHTDRP